MYEGVKIQGFRVFDLFEVKGFQRINLITGQNNSGKTALLEALFIHSGAVNAGLVFAIDSFRGIPQFQSPLESAVSALFTGFDTSRKIVIETRDKVNVPATCTLRMVPAGVVMEQAGAPPATIATS